MTMQPPPLRYRVVEKGRRLVVIDTLTGAPATRSEPRAAALPTPSAAPERVTFDGRSTLVTRPFYDDKAPRTLTLDPGATRRLESLRSVAAGVAVAAAVMLVVMPWLLFFAVVPVTMLLHRQTRAGLRAAVTRWLDRYDTGSRAS